MRAVFATGAGFIAVFPVQKQVAAAAGEGNARGERDFVILVVAVGGDATLNVAFDAGVFFVEDEVHDTGEGVGAVRGRSAAGDDVNARNKARRHGIHVDGAVVVVEARKGRADDALAVDQHQCAGRIDAAQVEVVDPAGHIGRGRRTAGGKAVREGGQTVHGVGDVRRGHGLQFSGAEDRHGRRGFVTVADNARTGHDDFVEGRGCGLRNLLSLLCESRAGNGGGQCHGADGRQDPAL